MHLGTDERYAVVLCRFLLFALKVVRSSMATGDRDPSCKNTKLSSKDACIRQVATSNKQRIRRAGLKWVE